MKKFKGYGFTLCVTAFLLVGLVGCDGTQTTSSTTQDETVKYTVEFMDGETVLHTEEVEEGDKVTEYTPDVDGKEFLGWFIEPTFIHEFDFDTPITKDTQIFGSFEDAIDNNTFCGALKYLLHSSEVKECSLAAHKI